MGLKLSIADKNQFSENTLNRLIQLFETSGEVIKDNRNVIKKLDFEGANLVVKSFAGMYFFNRLAYSTIRKSKAQRSFEFAIKLKSLSIHTPEPVGYFDVYKLGLLTKSYYISHYDPVNNLYEILNQESGHTTINRQQLINDFAVFIYQLHSKGIFHDDLSISNVLVYFNQDVINFSLVDLNRIKFTKITYNERIKNLSRLSFKYEEDLENFLQMYASLNHYKKENLIRELQAYSARVSYLRNLRKKIKYYTLTKVENLFNKLVIQKIKNLKDARKLCKSRF
jgi:tRNA A-37 threonylcarbamoyl transferase component Bud32